MSAGTQSEQEQDPALAEFERARTEFEEAVRRAPDAALRFRAPGDDYALGGLVVHVTQVLAHYAAVLAAIHAADWQSPTAPPSVTSDGEAALIRDGFGGDSRARILEQMRQAHKALVDAVRAEPSEWFSRKAPVTYSGSSEPYPTSPADVVGWVRDHYAEHTQQIADLVSVWAEATR
jgi:DinB superfamily